MIPNAIDILLVEDNPNDVEMTLRSFKKVNIANMIFVVNNGAEALEFLFGTGKYQDRKLNHEPKMIFLDLKLPKVDGLEVLRRIKGDEGTRIIPVVVLTSSKEEQEMVESFGLGVNSYIVKPLNFDKFVESVSHLGLYWLLLNQPPY